MIVWRLGFRDFVFRAQGWGLGLKVLRARV